MIIRDQIHGDMEFSDAEMKLITSRSFERLRYIKQLGFVETTFPGASHNRYQHSLGVCQCVTDMYNAVVKNYPDFYREGDLELLRMMALVHDLGHSPFSHASEALSDIAHEDRLGDILQYEAKNIILAHDYDIDSWDLIEQVYNGNGITYLSDPHLITLHSFMDFFIDADKMDYLERDSINCGVSYGKFDRQGLIRNLTIVKDETGIETIGILSSGIQALESFLLARYYMFSHIYTNPIERIQRYLFVKEMQTLLKGGKYPNDIKQFLQLDDTKFARKLKSPYNNPYVCVYDDEFNLDTKHLIDRKLGRIVLCDTPMKSIFRKDESDANIYIVNNITGQVKPCAEVSPIIKGVEFASVHKLRYYAEKNVANEIGQEILKVLRSTKL